MTRPGGVVAALVAVAVSLVGTGTPWGSDYAIEAYDVIDLPPEADMYDGRLVGRLDWADDDAAGVRQFTPYGGTPHDQPVQLAQEVLRLTGDRTAGADARYVERARRHADRLLDIAVDVRGALFFPYRFDFELHGDPSDAMRAPWYSAMAQGQALSAFVRLFELTGDPRYRHAADATFASFLDLGDPRRGGPWVSFVDGAGYLWFEEYPKALPMRVLNGHIFAIFGIYDYARLTGDAASRRLFAAGVTTVRAYGPQFRNPGGLSFYCLRLRITSEKYHFVHIAQMRALAAMTGDAWFAAFADRLADDFVVEPSARSPALTPPTARAASPIR